VRHTVGGRRPKLTPNQATLAQQLYDACEKTVQLSMREGSRIAEPTGRQPVPVQPINGRTGGRPPTDRP
jgi:hypothetical protein